MEDDEEEATYMVALDFLGSLALREIQTEVRTGNEWDILYRTLEVESRIDCLQLSEGATSQGSVGEVSSSKVE